MCCYNIFNTNRSAIREGRADLCSHKQLPLPSLHVGDVLAFERTGAYCMTEGISLFLSRDLPAVLYRHPDGQVDELRSHFATYHLNTSNLQK